MTFSEQLIHLIDEFAKRIGIIIDWTNANVMPYLIDLVGRYGQFHLIINIVLFVVCLLILIGCVIFGIEWAQEEGCDDPMLLIIFMVAMITIFFGGRAGYCVIQLLTIPEWFILEQLQGLM